MRTFIQKGQGYGSSTVSITAKIDGITVYTGNVDTVDTPLPALPQTESNFGSNIFTWNNSYSFQGTQSMEITVTGGTLLVTDTVANSEVNPSAFYTPFSQVIDGVTYYDPFTDEKINGVVTVGPPESTLPGQWYWTVPAGSTFTATVNISSAAIDWQTWSDTQTWSSTSYVINAGIKYVSTQPVPLGIQITDTAYWVLWS
jgi:hypothetical protein